MPDARPGAPRGDLRQWHRRAGLCRRPAAPAHPQAGRLGQHGRPAGGLPGQLQDGRRRPADRDKKFKAAALARLPLQLPLIRAALRAARRLSLELSRRETTRSARLRVAATRSALAWSDTGPSAGRGRRGLPCATCRSTSRSTRVVSSCSTNHTSSSSGRTVRPAAVLEQQVVALRDDQPVLRAYADRAGHRQLPGPVERRRVDGWAVSVAQPGQQREVPRDVEGLGRPLAVAEPEPGELVVVQVEAVHRHHHGLRRRYRCDQLLGRASTCPPRVRRQMPRSARPVAAIAWRAVGRASSSNRRPGSGLGRLDHARLRSAKPLRVADPHG